MGDTLERLEVAILHCGDCKRDIKQYGENLADGLYFKRTSISVGV